jgi:hypothetical protein
MYSPLSALVLLATLSGGPAEQPVFDSYKAAWEAGRERNLPVLVILNPGADSEGSPVDLDILTSIGHRRELLANYVVACVDTSTPEGQAVHKLFDSPPLPRVSVLDKQQKWQIYRTSKSLSAEDWNLVLEKYRKGEATPPAAPKYPNCPYCNLNR